MILIGDFSERTSAAASRMLVASIGTKELAEAREQIQLLKVAGQQASMGSWCST